MRLCRDRGMDVHPTLQNTSRTAPSPLPLTLQLPVDDTLLARRVHLACNRLVRHPHGIPAALLCSVLTSVTVVWTSVPRAVQLWTKTGVSPVCTIPEHVVWLSESPAPGSRASICLAWQVREECRRGSGFHRVGAGQARAERFGMNEGKHLTRKCHKRSFQIRCVAVLRQLSVDRALLRCRNVTIDVLTECPRSCC